MALVSLSELKDALGITTTDDDDRLSVLLDYASAWVESNIGRSIELSEHEETVVAKRGQFTLRNYPVVEVSECRSGVHDALDVRFTGSAMEALAYVTGTNVVVSSTDEDGNETQNAISRSGATIKTIADAINALAGWEAEVKRNAPAFALWPISPSDALNKVVSLPIAGLKNKAVIVGEWGQVGITPAAPSMVARVRYRAGYHPIPPELKGVVVDLVRATVDDARTVPQSDSISIGDYTRTVSKAVEQAGRLRDDWREIIDNFRTPAIGGG